MLHHVSPAYASCGRSSYMATFHDSSIELDRVTAPEKKGLLTQSTARWLTDPWTRTQFLSWANQWSSGESQTFINIRLLGLSGTYHWHAIDTFNTCSWWPTERSLTDTGGGYNLVGAGLPHIHSPTFPTSCLPFPLVAPLGLHFNQVLTTEPKFWV
jgi:hypothetical protein